MKVYIGADHRGFLLKSKIKEIVQSLHFTLEDLGTNTDQESCDYPIISYKVAQHVAKDKNSRGILVCMSGIGQSIAANKVPGAYAALCYNSEAAELSRRHNNANILVLGAQFVSPREVKKIVKVWLETKFEGGRHLRRFNQIKMIEKRKRI